MPGRISFDVNLGNARGSRDDAARRRDVLRILVLGDFSGRTNRGLDAATELARRPALAVDLDSFDAALQRLSPELRLGAGGDRSAGLPVRFETLDDFHPDHLYAALEPFRSLRESRARLLDPASFEEEAARLMEDARPAAVPLEAGRAAAPAGEEGTAGLLQRLIGAPAEPAAPTASRGVVDGLIRRLVQPHIKPGFTRSPAPYLAALDASAADLMRAVLHDGDFQALEANWRGLRRLVESLELGDAVTLHIADVSKAELLADLEACQGDPETSAAARLLTASARPGADAPRWSLLVGLYDFDADADDLALLGHLGVLAARAGAPLLAAARPGLVGCDRLGEDSDPRRWTYSDPEIEQRWTRLRRSPAARWLGLAMPRLLLRLPYGAKSDAIDSFAFEELSPAARHEEYLWGHASLACAQLVAQAFLDEGSATPGDGPLDIEDLPASVGDRDGERRLQPCAEFALPIRVGEELLQRGMIALLSHANRNAVRVLRLQSIAEPSSALAGLG